MSHQVRFIAALALALLVSGVAAAAQINVSQIEGRVISPEGKGVERAVIRVFDEGGVREAGRANSDQGGRFTVNVTPGRYTVEVDPVANPELAVQRQDVEILDSPGLGTGQRVNLTFRMKPAATGSRPARPHFDQQVPPAAKAEYDRAIKTFATNHEEALGALREALKLFPEYYDALELLGTEYVKGDNLDHALVVLQKAVEVNPKSEPANYGLGVAYYRKGRFDLAIQAFNRALAIVPTNANSMLYLGLAQTRSGNKKDAEVTLKKAHDMGAKGVVELHFALTQIYGESGRNRDAANQLKMLLKEKPDYKDAEKIRELIKRYESKG